MDTAALPADGLRQRAAVTRRTLAVLCNLITEYSAAAGCKPTTAACELAGIFRTIHDHLSRTAHRCLLSPDVCWAGSSHDLTSPCGGYQITPSSLAGYFELRGRGERRPAEHIDCSTETSWRTAHPVADDVIAFAPGRLASLIEASGQRVPAFLLHEPAPAEAPAPAPAAGAGRKRAARQAAPVPEQLASMPPLFAAQHAAWLKFWKDWTPDQPAPQQQTVANFIAEQVGLPCRNRLTSGLATAIRPLEAPTDNDKRKPRP